MKSELNKLKFNMLEKTKKKKKKKCIEFLF